MRWELIRWELTATKHKCLHPLEVTFVPSFYAPPPPHPRSILPQPLHLIHFHLLRYQTHQFSILSSRVASMEALRFFQSAVKQIQALRQNKMKNVAPCPTLLFLSDTCSLSISYFLFTGFLRK